MGQEIRYIALVKVLYNSSFTFTWLCLHAYIFQQYYLSIIVRQTIYERVQGIFTFVGFINKYVI